MRKGIRTIQRLYEEGWTRLSDLSELTGLSEEYIYELGQTDPKMKIGDYAKGNLAKNHGWLLDYITTPNSQISCQNIANKFQEEFGESVTRALVHNYLKKEGLLHKVAKSKRLGKEQKQKEKEEQFATNVPVLRAVTYAAIALTEEREGLGGVMADHFKLNYIHSTKGLRENLAMGRRYLKEKAKKGRDLRRIEVIRFFNLQHSNPRFLIERLEGWGLYEEQPVTHTMRDPEIYARIRKAAPIGTLSRPDIAEILTIPIRNVAHHTQDIDMAKGTTVAYQRNGEKLSFGQAYFLLGMYGSVPTAEIAQTLRRSESFVEAAYQDRQKFEQPLRRSTAALLACEPKDAIR